MFLINDKIPYQKEFPIDNFCFQNTTQTLVIRKSDNGARDDYFLHAYLYTPNGPIEQGYLYFSVTFKENKSKFIGVYIKEEYRNSGLASFLISSWIKLCLDNGIDILTTARKQRKPFILYLLKKYDFELLNPDLYDSLPSTIYICQKDNEKTKYLYFKNDKEAEKFRQSTVNLNDSYTIIPTLNPNFIVKDQVLLLRRYYLSDNNKAYQKANDIYNQRKI